MDTGTGQIACFSCVWYYMKWSIIHLCINLFVANSLFTYQLRQILALFLNIVNIVHAVH